MITYNEHGDMIDLPIPLEYECIGMYNGQEATVKLLKAHNTAYAVETVKNGVSSTQHFAFSPYQNELLQRLSEHAFNEEFKTHYRLFQSSLNKLVSDYYESEIIKAH